MFRSRQIVRFADVDLAGIVYYPRLLHYFHVAMEEFFAGALGLDYAEVLRERRFGLPAVHLEADFRRPLRYGDHLEVEVRVEAIGRTSLCWRFGLYRAGEADALADGRVVTVGLDLDAFEKREIPAWLREAVATAGA